jgi:hypothetical protein
MTKCDLRSECVQKNKIHRPAWVEVNRAVNHYIHLEISDRLAEIQYMYSNAPVSLIPHLGDLLAEAIQSSHQWKVERALGESKTACLTTIIPKDPAQDVSINLWVGAEAGHQLNDKFNLVPKWTSLPNHVGP